MTRFRRFELIEPCYYSPPSLSIRETSIFAPKTLALPLFLEENLDLDFLSPSPFEFFDAVTDLVRIDETPSFSSYRRIQKVERHGAESLYLQSLSDRVSQLESRFDRLVKGVDRKYTWTAEIKDGKKKKEEEVVVKRGGVEKNYKWTAEIKGRGEEGRPITKTYTFKAANGDDEDVDDDSDCVKSKKKEEKKKKEKKKKEESHKRTVEIEELGDHRAVVLRQVQKEEKQRKEVEEALVKEREELEKLKNLKDQVMEELRIAKEEKKLLKSQNEELQKKRDVLQIERDNALQEAEGLRRKQAEASTQMLEFLLSEIEEATQVFDESLIIGRGGYGNVYKGLLHQTEVAIKKLKSNGSQGPSEFEMEVRALSQLTHPNLVKLIGCCSEAFVLVYEYLPNGNLEDRLYCKNKSTPLSWQTRIHIVTELCSVLVYLHSRKPHSIVHGDLKPSNILLDTNFKSKLSDFGICRILCHERRSTNDTTLCHFTDPKGTFHYIDPDFYYTRKLTRKSDVYSFGVILLQLLTGRRPPFKMENDVQVALDAGKLSSLLDPLAGDWPIEIARNLAHLALRCCDRNRKNRPDLSSEVGKVLEQMRNSCAASSSRG